jgi:hypothetical protein
MLTLTVFLKEIKHIKEKKNILGLNSRVAHFNAEIDVGCTFCSLENNRPAPKETTLHLFYFCLTTHKIIEAFYANYIANVDFTPKHYFLCNVSNIELENSTLNIVHDVFRYVLR